MDEDAIARRGLLRTVGVAGGLAVTGLLASSSPAIADDDDDDDRHDDRHNRLHGSWLVTAFNEDGSQLQSVISLAAGDVAVVHDINPAGPPFTGTWAGRKGRSFRATVWSGFPGEQGPGSAGGTVRLRLEGRRERDTISGTFVATLFDPAGNELDTFGGTFSGSRIEA